MTVAPKSIDASDLAEVADVLEAELDGWRNERDSLDARITKRERVVADLRGEAELGSRHLFEVDHAQPYVPLTNGNGSPNGGGTQRPGTGDAIVAVLRELGVPATGGEVFHELKLRDWLPVAAHPRNAVRTSLWNLAERGRILKLGDGPATRRWALENSNGSHPHQAEGP
jgi:hypothetical protein